MSGRGAVRGWRRWRVALAVLALAVACSIGWGGFVWFRTSDRPGGTVAAGEEWRSPEGYRLSLVDYLVTPSVVDDENDTQTAPAGTVWVVVHLQFHDLAPGSSCSFDLAGPGRVRWTTASGAPSLPGPTYCAADDAGPDAVVHAVFQVPETWAPRVRGVVLSHPMMLRQPPLFLRP